jgi:hypothetical protein
MGIRARLIMWIVDGKIRHVSYKEWDDLIQASFEQNYFVPIGQLSHTPKFCF